MQRARDQFLPGPAFAGDERRRVGCGKLPNELENLLHGLASSYDAQFIILLFEQRLVGDHLLHVPGRLERVEDNFLELGNVERFEQVIVGAQLHRLDGRLGRAIGRHQDHEQFGIHLPYPPQGLQSVNSAHPDVHDHQIRLEFGNRLKSFLAARSGGQLDFRRIKYSLKRVLHVRLVINQQQSAHKASRITKTAGFSFMQYICKTQRPGRSGRR